MAFVKRAVSKKKRRFQESGFDLDLSYVTDRIIAMGFPSENMEGMYRNSMTEVLRFLETFHADHYKVYNLCSEREYDPAKFHNRCARYPFDDHNPPPLDLLAPFCEDVEEWFKEDEENIAVIHCKAGKGRTGVMISCWLLYCRMWPNAAEALAYYGAARTKNQKGVTIASQIRYVDYFSTIVREGGYRSVELVFLKRVRLTAAPKHAKSIYFVIKMRKNQVFTTKATSVKGREPPLDWDINAPLMEDCLLVFYEKSKLGSDDKLFQMWFHTSYIDGGLMVVPKNQIDKANKDKKHKLFPEDMALELYFDVPIPAKKPDSGSMIGTDAVVDAALEEALDENNNPVELYDDNLASSEDDDDMDGTASPAMPSTPKGKGKGTSDDDDEEDEDEEDGGGAGSGSGSGGADA